MPPAIQERMRRAAEKGAEHERAEGLAIARELAAGIAALARGIHVMPMGKYKAVGEILEAVPRPEAARPPGPGLTLRPESSRPRLVVFPRAGLSIESGPEGGRRATSRRRRKHEKHDADGRGAGRVPGGRRSAGRRAVPPVTGTVTDSSGAPVEGATVTITTPSLTTFKLTLKSDAKGKYGTILNDCTMPYHVKFEKEGFATPASRQEDPDRRQRVVDMKLLKTTEAKAAPGAAPAAARASSNEQAVMAFNTGVEALNAGDKAGGRDEVPGGHQEESRPPAGLAGPDAARLREEGLGQDARVRPEGHRSRSVDDEPLRDDGGRRQADGRQEGGRRVAAKYAEANPDRPRSSTTRASTRTTRAR